MSVGSDRRQPAKPRGKRILRRDNRSAETTPAELADSIPEDGIRLRVRLLPSDARLLDALAGDGEDLGAVLRRLIRTGALVTPILDRLSAVEARLAKIETGGVAVPSVPEGTATEDDAVSRQLAALDGWTDD